MAEVWQRVERWTYGRPTRRRGVENAPKKRPQNVFGKGAKRENLKVKGAKRSKRH